MTEKTKSPEGVGLDIGTMNIVAARRGPSGVVTTRMRDVFIDLPPGAKKMLKLSNTSFVERADDVLILGDAALEMANVFGRDPRRPLADGIVSPKETESLEVLGLLVKSVLGAPAVPNERCYFSVPAVPVDRPDKNIVYHKGVFEKIVRECGYDARFGNEAMAIIYSQTSADGFSGIALSFGSGMVNCLAGDTSVVLLDGTTPTIKELADSWTGEPFYVFSCRPDGQIVPGRAHHPRKTGTRPVLRVHLDDGGYVDLTEDHQVLRRDGFYVEAGKLVSGDSLMPLYTCPYAVTKRRQYQRVKNNRTGKWKYVHRLVAETVIGRKLRQEEVVHHVNFDGLDNRPDNLDVMLKTVHTALHTDLAGGSRLRTAGKTYEELFGVEEATRLRNRIACAQADPEVRTLMSAGARRGAETIRKIRTGKTFKDIFGEPKAGQIRAKLSEAKRGKTLTEIVGDEEQALEIRTRRSVSMKGKAGKYIRTPEIRERISKSLCERTAATNHKVVSVERLGSVDVYDLTVDEHHNFGLACGVFVHNCALAINTVEALTFSVARGGDWIDAGAAGAIGQTPARMCALKEGGIDLTKPVGREQEALAFYYKEAINYALDQIEAKFREIKDKFSLTKPIPMIVSGGTSLAGGFMDFYTSVFEARRKKFPIPISAIRHATDPLNAVAHGLLVQALQEDE